MECISNTSYRSNCNVVKSDSESSESDEENSDVWKRRSKKSPTDLNEPLFEENKLNVPSPVLPRSNTLGLSDGSRKRKANNIWSSVIHEQTVSDDLGQFGLVRKPVNAQDRSCESYDFTRKMLDTRSDDTSKADEAMDSDKEISDDSNDTKPTHKSVKQRLGDNFKRRRTSKFVEIDKDGVDAAKKIIRILNEKKAYLIYRIVHVVGVEKAMQLVKMTEQVEDAGGMLIKNNSRKRTPGGVYLQLLKADKSITKKMIDEIFAGEMNFSDLKKQSKNRYRDTDNKIQRKKRNKWKQKKSSTNIDMDIKVENSEVPAPNEDDMVVNDPDIPINGFVEEKESLAIDPKCEDSEIEEGEIQD